MLVTLLQHVPCHLPLVETVVTRPTGLETVQQDMEEMEDSITGDQIKVEIW